MPTIKFSKKEMEYPDSPSGYVTLYNYKEPFMRYEKGFGFEGVLLFDGETDKIQCHLCGEWFGALPQHVAAEHNMKAKQYKEEVGLMNNTALISESMRAKLIASGLDHRLANLRKYNRNNNGKKSEETKRKISEGLKRAYKTREGQNIRGTCPEQLISRLKNKYIELGRTPGRREIPAEEALVKVYGSYENACKIAGIPYRIPGRTIKSEQGRSKWSRKNCIEWVNNFFDINERLPKAIELPKMMSVHFYSKKFDRDEIFRDALALNRVYRKHNGIRYTKQQLIDFLKTFKKIHGRNPSYSDCKRGLLPVLSRYSYHFGSWKNALKESGL